MSFSDDSTTTFAADNGGHTSVSSIHTDIIQSHILSRLNGTALASTSCASKQFLSLCGEDRLWREICNAAWPSTTHCRVRTAISSFPSAHRSFYRDTFPCIHHHHHHHHRNTLRSPPTLELISAVDIRYGERLLYSKVLETETHSSWFLSSPFRLDLLSPKQTIPTPLKFEGEESAVMAIAEERLKLSWILIDPANNRAINAASQRAVESRRHWLNDDVQLRFATVVTDLVQCVVVATCGGKEAGEFHVKDVSMQLEDMDGKILSGRDSLGILQETMAGVRRNIGSKFEIDIYEMYLRKKEQYRERTQRREKGLDLIFIITGVTVFVAVILFLLCR